MSDESLSQLACRLYDAYKNVSDDEYRCVFWGDLSYEEQAGWMAAAAESRRS